MNSTLSTGNKKHYSVNHLMLLLAILFLTTAPAKLQAQNDIEASTLVKIGQVAPEFSYTNTKGDSISLNSCKGKTVLVVFFATWCGPCMQELPEVETKLWKKYQEKGIKVVAIGRDHSMEEMKTFIDKKKFTFEIAPDPGKKIYSLYASKYIPRSFLINKEGVIIHQVSSYNEEEFKKLLEVIEKTL